MRSTAMVKLLLAVSMLGAASGQSTAPHASRSGLFRWNWHATQWADETLGKTAKLNADEKLELETQILGSINTANLSAVLKGKLRDDALETRFKLIDLNRDGTPDVIAQASGDFMCGATGNCTFWVFMRDRDKYKILLQEDGIQGFTIQPTKTNGFHDLVLTRHESADWLDLFLYTFGSNGYRTTGCQEANWVRMVGNERVELKDPIISACK